MTERKAQPDPNEPPEDVASLYSWANLHGAKYRDFSASRAQIREKARQRVEQAIEEERMKVREEAEAQRAEAARSPEERQRVDPTLPQGARAPTLQQSNPPAATSQGFSQSSAWQPPRLDRYVAPPNSAQFEFSGQEDAGRADDPLGPPQYRTPSGAVPPSPMREETYAPARITRGSPSSREETVRPAWLTPERFEPASSALPSTPDDTLQGSRDRLASRWFALQGIFENAAPPAQSAPAPATARAPVLAVFSLAGGVGKTSLVATLGRALSGRGERVLLVDTAAYGLLPFFFGARDQRPGFLRTFSPPPSSGDASIQMITLDPDTMGAESPTQEVLSTEITKNARGVGRVIIDLATASGSVARRVVRMSPQVLVPLIPDMSSVVSVGSIDTFFQHNGGSLPKPTFPHYVLNQFDSSLPLHLDVREILREQLGDRLLPFVLRHSPTVSEALAEGMTVMDYAPNSSIADDFASLAGWVKSLSAPATASFRGVRWSER
jgi:cellulose synthase operon protein YhjQ